MVQKYFNCLIFQFLGIIIIVTSFQHNSVVGKIGIVYLSGFTYIYGTISKVPTYHISSGEIAVAYQIFCLWQRIRYLIQNRNQSARALFSTINYLCPTKILPIHCLILYLHSERCN